MKINWGWWIGLTLACAPVWGSPPIWFLTVADSINPGTADYVAEGIENAEKEKAPFVLITLDTPGGLLSSTRTIAQKILNANLPVVVFISPKGAHAGSAGALITFGSDIAAMAPGTQLGAAHPVTSTGTKLDRILEDKITNDTAAFAESLAKNRGRNADWATDAVRKSASISAEEALKIHAIDLVAEDVPDLLKKLSRYPLKAPKRALTQLPEGPWEIKTVVPTIRQKLLSFFSNPDLAYLILVLGGLCLWIELAHPGLILPGALGAVCVAISLISFQLMPIHYGALLLILLGMALLVAELFLPTFGVLGVGGLASFIIGSLFLIDTPTPDYHLSLILVFPSAAALGLAALILSFVVLRSRRIPSRSGIGALVGQMGEVRELVTEDGGKIFVAGELWNAVTENSSSLSIGTHVVVTETRNMLLLVQPVRSHKEPNA